MKLKRLGLENVCQHRKLEHVWHPGLNGIVGPNGSGKSNVVKAIKFAIAGGFDNAGTKDENVYQLARDKSRSQVTLVFEHDGVEAEVTRVLRRGTSSCRIGGGPVVEGDTLVTAAIMDFLGVDKRILSEYIFVQQRHMAGFVDETPAERNRTFGQLFDLAKADAIYRLLDAAIKRINPAQPSPEIGPLKERIAEARRKCGALKTDISVAKGQLQKLDEAGAKAVIGLADRWDMDQKIIDTLSPQVDALAADLEASQAELAAADAERAELVKARDDAATDIDAARDALARWETVRQRRLREDVIKRRQDMLDDEPPAHPKPELPDGYLDDKEIQGRIDELSHSVSMRNDLLAKFKDKPKVCPTCGAETDAILKKAAAYKAELPMLEKLLADLHQRREAYRGYNRASDRWQDWHHNYQQRQAAMTEEWDTFKAGAVEAPTADPATCRSVVEAGEGLERAILETAARVAQLRKEVNQRAARLDQDNLKLVKLQTGRGDPPHEQTIFDARRALEAIGPAKQRLARAEGELHAVLTNLGSDEKMLGRLEEAERKAETDRLWAYQLAEVRKVMHHDQLPKVVAHNYLEILADDTNELLESFDADFTVGLGEGLNFEATFMRGLYAGTVSPAQRLSEGQKVILALAFRVAVNSLFAGTAGLLCLDEPTESLDERNLACLEVAIGRMRDLSQSRGIQCLLVTHEPSFEFLFDGVLRLAA